MFTVLIAEKEHINAIQQENKLFFEPFLSNKDLAFCEWIPSGQTLLESVPGLSDAVGRRKDWRVVILNPVEENALKMRNPFDVVDCEKLRSATPPPVQPEINQTFDQWESDWKEYYSSLAKEKESVYRSALQFPLQKLVTWLCFKPEDYILNEVQEKQDVHDWAIESIGRDEKKASIRLEFLEREQYKKELRIKECIRRDFVAQKYLNVSYPSEVHCIAIRTMENTFFDPDIYWNVRQDSDYSKFSDRNMYFDKMRFMVFDLLPKSHRNFRTDYIRFLASILIFVTNPVPGSSLQARRLYRLETETDDSPLCMLVTSYDRKLENTAEVIESEIERIRSEIPGQLTDKAAEAMFCSSKEVAVLLDESCDTEKVFAEKDYGLFYDSPEREHYKWNRDYQRSEKAMTYIAKQQSRSVRKSVNQLHLSGEVFDVNVHRLTSFQMDDVKDYTESAENEMIASIPPDLADVSQYTDRLEKESEAVKKVLDRRMTKKTTVILSLICLALYFVCFLPFLFANNGTPKTVTTAVVLSAVAVGVLAGILFVALFFLRASVLNAVKSYNNTARVIMGEIRASMKRFSKYLTSAATVIRGHTVLNHARKNLDEYTKGIRIRKKHLEDIRKRRAYLAEDYRDYFGDRSSCDETMSRPYEYDFDQRTEYPYPAPFLAGDFRQIEFISKGNLVLVPFSYVTGIVARMEGIYER